jgi:predicted metal-dependent hydrolase
MNALSLLFPEGEQFFVDSVKHLQARITTPELQDRVAGFIGQEAMHGREHRAFNEMLVAHGFVAAPRIEARLKWFLRIVRKILTRKSQLAVTCALEHFTALLGESVLRDARLRAEVHPSMRALWLWHAFEESEHKAVAFDVYREVGGGYVRRSGMMLVTTAFFFAAHGLIHLRLMAARGVLWRPWQWPRALFKMWVWPAYLTRLVPSYLAYFRPRFHPDHRDTEALLALWREQLFGNHGELRTYAAAG